VAGTLAGFERSADDLRSALDASGVSGRARHQVELVFEEVVTNIIRHGYADGRDHVIEVSLTRAGDAIVVTFEDDGRPFDPLQQPSPPVPRTIEVAPVGGLGIHLVRAAAADLRYERTPDARNRLTVTILVK
jgi:anti-sigma regulatory factor (Ser/Thr protein kinase)